MRRFYHQYGQYLYSVRPLWLCVVIWQRLCMCAAGWGEPVMLAKRVSLCST